MKKPFFLSVSFLRRYEIFLASFLVIFTVFLLTLIFLLPSFRKLSSLSAETKKIKEKITKLKNKERVLEKIDGQKYSEGFRKLTKVLPPEKDYLSLFFTFDHLEENTGLKILNVSFPFGPLSAKSSARAEKSGAYPLPISFEVSGTLEQFEKLFSLLSDFSGRIFLLESVNFDLKKKDEGLIKARFLGKTYFYPLATPKIGLETTVKTLSQEEEEIFSQILQKMTLKVEEEIKTEEVKLGKENLFD